jgi:hypothetical protein
MPAYRARLSEALTQESKPVSAKCLDAYSGTCVPWLGRVCQAGAQGSGRARLSLRLEFMLTAPNANASIHVGTSPVLSRV